MLSRKMAIVAGVILFIAVNLVVLSLTAKYRQPASGIERAAVFITAPFQKAFQDVSTRITALWRHYFFLVHAAKENDALKKDLQAALEENRKHAEIDLVNKRLKKFLDFQESVTHERIAAEVVGKDPSPWFKTIVVDKGGIHGVRKGLPVVTPDGIAGQVVESASRFSKVMLIIDQNSAVDALVQRTRTRGIVEGGPGNIFNLKYVLRKEDIKVGDSVISSGLDGVFPKGFDIGHVSGVVRPLSGVFQEVTVMPSVDFDKLEEVLILLNPPQHEPEERQ